MVDVQILSIKVSFLYLLVDMLLLLLLGKSFYVLSERELPECVMD